MGTKICCLVLVHKNVHQLCRLCKQMNHPQITVFVHFDKKMNLNDEDIIKISSVGDNIKILPERFSCFLDEWSLVEATLALLRYAKTYMNEEKSVYYALLSGQDYFIKPITDFVAFLDNKYPKPYIDCTPYNVGNWVYPKFTHTPLAIWGRKLNRILKIRGFLFVSCWMEILFPRIFFADYKLFKYRIPLFGGSAWWVLPDVIVNEMFDYLDENKQFVRDFKNTVTPEETFFQTMSMHSSLSHMIDLNDVDEREQNCLTYANFSPEGKIFSGHPYCIVKDDFKTLIKRHEFIARKFDETCDSEILDKLDDYIEHNEDIYHNDKF